MTCMFKKQLWPSIGSFCMISSWPIGIQAQQNHFNSKNIDFRRTSFAYVSIIYGLIDQYFCYPPPKPLICRLVLVTPPFNFPILSSCESPFPSPFAPIRHHLLQTLLSRQCSKGPFVSVNRPLYNNKNIEKSDFWNWSDTIKIIMPQPSNDYGTITTII